MSRSRWVVVLGLTVAGCGPVINPPGDVTASTGEETGQVISTSSGGSTSSGTTCSTYDCDPMPSSTGLPQTVSGVDFIRDPDGGSPCVVDPNWPGQPRCSYECSLWEQDCLTGEKCTPWANDGTDVWNAARCAPVDPSPGGVGEPCTVEGGSASGIDDCGVGLMCWNVDDVAQEGTCIALCGGNEADPVCPGLDDVCVVAASGLFPACLPGCDPRDPLACPDGQGCYPFGDSLVCVPFDAPLTDGSQPCEFPASCEPGTVCVEDEISPQCSDPPCCAAWCDTQSPDPTCPAETACTAYYEPAAAPTGLETLGVCLPA